MPATVPQPTPYPDVNAVLHLLCSSVQTLLGQRFLGMYLYGSLASGDFNPHRSDIDLVIVTTEPLPDDLIPALEAMHAQIWASGLSWAKKLEGCYIPQQDLRRYEPGDAQYPSINEGHFYLDRHGSEWIIQRHILREHGVVVAGPPPHTLIDPVHPDDLKRAVLGFLHQWWQPMLDNPTRLQTSEYQAYAILTMCRALYTFDYGTIVSKPVAARWAQETLGRPWAAVIEWALAWSSATQGAALNEALELIRYTVERGDALGILPNTRR